MEYQETICAVVVTYNRKNLLLECLNSLIKQSRPIDALYIIDNNSSDGTEKLLFDKGFISELPPENIQNPWEREFILQCKTGYKEIKCFYVRMHENTGGAGGFYEGVKRGYERGYDWLWLMDDDVEPLSDGLSQLLKYKHISKCIHPSKKYLNGDLFHVEQARIIERNAQLTGQRRKQPR
ncbi:MAG: glycosyltransferase, partial [Bacteroidales bacterium]